VMVTSARSEIRSRIASKCAALEAVCNGVKRWTTGKRSDESTFDVIPGNHDNLNELQVVLSSSLMQSGKPSFGRW
jgi:hypothetical protein